MFEILSAISTIIIGLILGAFVYYLYHAYTTNSFDVLAYAVVNRYKEPVWLGYDLVVYIGCGVSIYYGFAASALTMYLIAMTLFVAWAYWYVRNK